MKNRQPRGVTGRRLEVFKTLQGQVDPVGIDGLATMIGRHPNTVREQVQWLHRHGFVARFKSGVSGRGRPAWLYSATWGGATPTDLAQLAASLAWAFEVEPAGSEGSDAERVDSAGREFARQLLSSALGERVRAGSDGPAAGSETEAAPVDTGPDSAAAPDSTAARRWVVEALDEMGYQPVADEPLDTVELHHCPLLQAAANNVEVTCGIHVRMIETLLGEAGVGTVDVGLEPFSAPGRCTLHLRGAQDPADGASPTG